MSTGRFYQRSTSKAGSQIFLGDYWTKYSWSDPIGPTRFSITNTAPFQYVEAKWSEGHPGPPYHTGGPFSVYRAEDPYGALTNVGTYVYEPNQWIRYTYQGGFVINVRHADVISPSVSADTFGITEWLGLGDSAPYGPIAWSKYAPGKSVADLAVMLGEIRDVPRMMQQTARGFHDTWKHMRASSGLSRKKLADHWLNTQFGWLPFVSDIRKLYRAYQQAEKSYQRVRAENGRWVRRGGTVLEEVDSEEVGASSTTTRHMPVLPSSMYLDPARTGSWTASRLREKHVWFMGAFRYWIPNVDSVEWKRWYLARLFGGVPTPSLVWELTPWSWLIDWFSNAGDVIQNIDTGWANELAAKYAYVMCTETQSVVTHSSHNLACGSISGSCTHFVRAKTRTGANPFGFGLTWDNLSPRQLSILGALGVSRGS